MLFEINPSSTTPIYAQIKEQIRYCIASGRLSVDNKLPSVRQLAIELRVNPNTVAKAYRELELEGTIRSRKGQGTFVAPSQSEVSYERRIELLTSAIDSVIVKAHHLSLSDSDVRSLLEQRMKDMHAKQQGEVDDD